MTYGVEGKKPKSTKKVVGIPERRSSSLGCLCNGSSNQSKCHVEADACTCTNSWTADAMCQKNAKKLTAEESEVIQAEGYNASLVSDIAPAVHRGGTRDLCPNHKDESDIVDPSVYAVKEVVPKFCAVG